MLGVNHYSVDKTSVNQSPPKVILTHFLLALKKHSIFTVALLYQKHNAVAAF